MRCYLSSAKSRLNVFVGLQSTVTIVRAGRCKAFLFVAVDRLEPNRRFALVLRCLAVAPGYRCDFAGRAKWGSIVGTAMLTALLLAFAPGALLGDPSTSLMLCLAAVAVLAQSRAGNLSLHGVPLVPAPSLVSGAGFWQ